MTGHPDTESGHLIPGVRYRTETRKRLTPVTRNGETRTVPLDQDVHVPLQPRDWDRIVLTGVSTVAVAVLLASVVWSTASAGDLLARAVIPPVAYLAAVVFDVAWISCLALEWLARYDDERAKGPRRAGHLALLIAMAAVCANGWLEDSLVVGLASAAISALAKSTWTRVMRHQARPLDPETRAWLEQRDAEISARLILGARLRQQARAEGQHAALLATTAPALPADAGPDTSGRESGPGNRASGTVRAAVHAAAGVLPDPTPAAIVAHLSAVGVDTDPDTVSALLSEEQLPAVQPIRPPGQSVADSVRTALASGVTDPSAVLTYVRTIHGQAVKGETVDRYLRRERDPA